MKIQFFCKLVCINRKGPRKQEFPKRVEKRVGGNGNFKDGGVTHNGGYLQTMNSASPPQTMNFCAEFSLKKSKIV